MALHLFSRWVIRRFWGSWQKAHWKLPSCKTGKLCFLYWKASVLIVLDVDWLASFVSWFPPVDGAVIWRFQFRIVAVLLKAATRSSLMLKILTPYKGLLEHKADVQTQQLSLVYQTWYTIWIPLGRTLRSRQTSLGIGIKSFHSWVKTHFSLSSRVWLRGHLISPGQEDILGWQQVLLHRQSLGFIHLLYEHCIQTLSNTLRHTQIQTHSQ